MAIYVVKVPLQTLGKVNIKIYGEYLDLPRVLFSDVLPSLASYGVTYITLLKVVLHYYLLVT